MKKFVKKNFGVDLLPHQLEMLERLGDDWQTEGGNGVTMRWQLTDNDVRRADKAMYARWLREQMAAGVIASEQVITDE